MAQVLVTGGTGMLGSYLVPCLLGRGHVVRVLSRRPWVTAPEGAGAVFGDVRTGEGVGDAIDAADAVIHAATSPGRRASATEVNGTRNVIAAARRVGAHLIYVSIVGVDRISLPYYRAKWRAEQLVESDGAGWTIQRATQFHDLLAKALRARVVPATRHLAFQPVDAGEVSTCLADLVEAGPSGRVEDYGGPAVLPLRQVVATYRAVTARRALAVPLPALGFARHFDEGRHLCPQQARGRVTWEDWLRSTSSP